MAVRLASVLRSRVVWYALAVRHAGRADGTNRLACRPETFRLAN
jgi:hypothetical protein